MEVYFIINEYAGNGRGAYIWSKLKKQLNFSYTAMKTEYPKHAKQLANDIGKTVQHKCLVIGIGGDGTMSEIVSGAKGHYHIVISAIKAGSGNDFANGYSVFNNASELNDYIKHNHISSSLQDLGRVQSTTSESTFVNNAGFGFDALVATTVNQSKLKEKLNIIGLGRLAYVFLTIKLLFSYRTFHLDATIDGKPYHFDKIWFVTLCNQPYFGGGMKISPRSKMNDSTLEFVIVQYLSPLKLLLLFLTVFTGKHEKLKEVTFIKASTISLRFNQTIVSHIDGDLFEYIGPEDTIHVSIDEEKWSLAKPI